MSRWFRYYDDALDDPKVQRLSGDLFKVWVNLLSLASKNDGKLPSADDISFRLRISVQDAQQRVEDLILAGLIDIQPDGTKEPHNWSERQFASDSSAVRMQKLRKKKQSKNSGDVTSDVTVTVQTQTRGEANTNNKLQLSNPVATREVKSELGFNLNSKSGLGKRDGMETLLRQAEGFGLDVEELVEITNRNNPKSREGYFVSLCVNRLKDKLPGLDPQIIRSALNGKHEQSKTVCALLVGAIP
jgi:hypothetical protein